MLKSLLALSVTLMGTALAASAGPESGHIYITIGSDAVGSANKSLAGIQEIESADGISVLRARKGDIARLSHMMHEKFNRCAGFVAHESLEEAKEVLNARLARQFGKSMQFMNYTIDQHETVDKMTAQTSEFSIRAVIEKLVTFHNRFYKAESGVESQAWVKSRWEELSQGRNDVTVEYFNHRRWPQPSVVLTLEGSRKKDEIVVIGGHADSISGWWGQRGNRAPGADDNASGIATITETIRLAMENGYKPERTVKFIGYAAEEVGLLGSKEIAKRFKKDGKNVVGVLQLDMTNHKGTDDLDIVFMNDYTNKAQNEFMARLVDEYVKVPWGWSSCGYGCSDHASWHNEGFPASMPFESTMGDINRKIHTDDDVLANSGSNADHAEKFAKLAVAFMVEMGK